MSQAEEEEPTVELAEDRKKSPVKVIVFSAAGALVIGAAAAGAGYFLTPASSGRSAEIAQDGAKKGGRAGDDVVTYVNLEPLVVTLGENARSRYLKITISLETSKAYEKSLNELTPRIRDTLNTFLRAVDEKDLVEPAAMARLRAQMLRRLRLVAPDEEISDVLITDFVLT